MENIVFSDFIKQEYADRKKSRPKYSERAFAKFLKLSPGFLKLFFQGKKSISVKRAIELGRRLNWSEIKINLAIDVLQKSKSKNQYILDGRQDEPLSKAYQAMSLENFTILSEWYFFAIVELCDLYPEGVTLPIVIRRLGLSEVDASLALMQLVHAGLITHVEKKYKKLQLHYGVAEQDSDIIRKYHTQVLEKSIHSLSTQILDVRENMALVLSFDSAKMKEAKAAITKFTHDFNQAYSGEKNDSVYQLIISFFSLTNKEATNAKN